MLDSRMFFALMNVARARIVYVLMFLPVCIISHAEAGSFLTAESGFNDASGVNSDGIVNSPYEFGETVDGRGAGEPNWNGNTWVISADGGSGGQHLGIAVSDIQFEGDGALYVQPPGTGIETWAYRLWGVEMTTPFTIETHVRLPANSYFQSRPGREGIGPEIGPHWRVIDGIVDVIDGVGDGGGTFENTGFVINPLEWHKYTTVIDPVAETYEFYFDGQKYNAPDPLNFRGDPAFLDRVDYLTRTDAWIDNVRVIGLVPEPASILFMFATPFFLRRRR